MKHPLENQFFAVFSDLDGQLDNPTNKGAVGRIVEVIDGRFALAELGSDTVLLDLAALCTQPDADFPRVTFHKTKAALEKATSQG